MKNLDESSFFITRNAFSGLTTKDDFFTYLRENGFHYKNVEDGWQWTRKDFGAYNYITHTELIEQQLKWLREEWSRLPGSANVPLSVDGYNRFARWDLWKGGYVDTLGYVPAPASSIYGASVFLGSWYPKGCSTNPVSVEKFYSLVRNGQWRGGYVEGWGEVSAGKKVLGTSHNFGFTNAPVSQRVLCNLVNLSTEIADYPLDIPSLKENFKSYWDSSRESYEIDNSTLRGFLNSRYHIPAETSIKTALDLHYGVLLREVTRTDYKDGITLKYGTDFLIVEYNPMLNKYAYISPLDNTVGYIDENIITSGLVEIVAYVCYYRKRE